MNWLDLGWLRSHGSWEFYAWGPFYKGYCFSAAEGDRVRRRLRKLRLAMCVAVLVAVGLKLLWGWAVVAIWLALAGCGEAFGTWKLVQGYPRTAAPLGWKRGWNYLSRWGAPKLLVVAGFLALLFLAISLLVLWRYPQAWGSYLLLGAAIGVQYFLFYLEQFQRWHLRCLRSHVRKSSIHIR